MKYEEGTVGFLIEELNKIKDKNKKVYWVETQYDDYSCYGDGFTTTFHLVDGFGEEAIKDGIVLGGERIDCDKEPLSVYSLNEVGTVIFTEIQPPDGYSYLEEYEIQRYEKARDFIYMYENYTDLMKQNLTWNMIRTVKVVTGYYNFKDFIVEMTPEQCYNYLRENNLVYMEEDDEML